MHENPLANPVTWSVLSKTGIEFYEALVEHWANALGVAVAFVVESVDPHGNRVCPVACWGVASFHGGFCYDTQGTPCERLRRAAPGLYPDRLAERFPDDPWIARCGMQSYVGLPLLDPAGRVLGLIGVMDDKPLKDPQVLTSLLEAFVPRCSAEMLRTRRDLALERLVGDTPWALYRAAAPQFAADILTSEREGFLGFSTAELVGDADLRGRQLFDDDRERVLAVFAEAMETGQDFRAHYRLWDRSRSVLHQFEDYGGVERDREGRPTHLSGVLVDVTSRRVRGAERQHRERGILARLDDLPGLVFSCPADSVWRMKYVGGACRALTGYGPDELVHGSKSAFRLLVHPADRERVQQVRQAAAERGDGYRIDYRLLDLHQVERHIAETGRGVHDAAGRPTSVDGFILDHTEQDEALLALAASEERFRTMAATAQDAILMLDERGCVVFWNEAATRMLGYGAEEAMGKNVHLLLAAPDDRDRAMTGMRAFAASGTGEVVNQIRQLSALRKDGTEIPVELSVSSLQIGGRWHALGVLRDVSEREQVLAELRESETRFRTLFEEAADGLLIADPASGRFITGNQCMADQLRCRQEELSELAVADIHPEEDLPRIRAEFERLAGLDHGESLDIAVKRRDGTLYVANISSSRITYGGNTFLVGAFRDVTERIEAERRLQVERTRLKGYLDNAPVVTVVFDLHGRVQLINRRGCSVLGYTPDEVIGRHWFSEFVTPADQASAQRGFARCLGNPPGACGSSEYSLTTRAGDIRQIAWLSGTLQDEAGETIGLMVSGEDVTERRGIERALKGAQERLEMVVQTIPAVLYACAPQESLPMTFVGGYLREHFGIHPDTVLGRSGDWRDYAHQEDQPHLSGCYPRLLRDGQLETEFRLRSGNGEYCWVQNELRIVRDDQGEPHKVVGYLLDIGRRKVAEQALREREAGLAHAQSIASLGSWESNLQTGAETWSDEIYRIFGFAPRTFVPSREGFLERVHPDDAERVRQRLRDVTDRETVFDLEFRTVRPNGEERYLRARGEIRRDEDGRPASLAGTLLDFTERKQVELSLERSSATLRELAAHLQSVREDERSAVAREIHDEMGQVLTTLKIDLVRLRSRLKDRKDAAATDLVASMLRSVDDAITTVQRIMAELRPSVLDDLGLIAAIEWQTRQFSSRTGVACELDLPEAPLHLSQRARTALFRILQESLTNVARHASASRVRVSLIPDPDWTTLSVDDNGKGISPLDLEDSHSFGLLGMRERAAVFGGKVEIRGEANAGTAVKVSLPTHTLNGDSDNDHAAYG
jgi:PAS domain S-box-containing protein